MKGLFSKVDTFLDYYSAPVYIFLIVFIYLIYFSVLFGLSWFESFNKYVHIIDRFMQIVVGLFLVFRFMPFRKHDLHKNDSTLIFASGVIILTNLGFISYLEQTASNKILPIVTHPKNWL
jgi:hypothetical protein